MGIENPSWQPRVRIVTSAGCVRPASWPWVSEAAGGQPKPLSRLGSARVSRVRFIYICPSNSKWVPLVTGDSLVCQPTSFRGAKQENKNLSPKPFFLCGRISILSLFSVVFVFSFGITLPDIEVCTFSSSFEGSSWIGA